MKKIFNILLISIFMLSSISFSCIDVYGISNSSLIEFKLAKGESAEITNTSGLNLRILTSASSTNDTRFDYVYYAKGNYINTTKKNSSESEIYINSEYRLKITALSDKGLTLYIPPELSKSINKVDGVALKTITVSKGQNIEVTNNSTDRIEFTSNISRVNNVIADTIVYNGVGSILYMAKDSVNSNFPLEAQNKARISVTKSEKVEFYVPVEVENMITFVDTKAIIDVTINENETFELFNDKRIVNIFQLNLDSGVVCNDYRYDKAGHMVSGIIGPPNKELLIMPYTTVKLSLYSGKSMKVSIDGSESKNYKISKTPIFYQLNLKQGEKYTINNKTNVNYFIGNTSNLDEKAYTLKMYYPNGEQVGYYLGENGSIDLKAGYKVEVTVLKENLSLYIPYELRIVQDVNVDGYVNITDLSAVASAYNSKINTNNYKSILDINNDKIIDLYDICMVGKQLNN